MQGAHGLSVHISECKKSFFHHAGQLDWTCGMESSVFKECSSYLLCVCVVRELQALGHVKLNLPI